MGEKEIVICGATTTCHESFEIEEEIIPGVTWTACPKCGAELHVFIEQGRIRNRLTWLGY